MDKYMEMILKGGFGNIIDNNMNKLIHTDSIYRKDSMDEDELEKKYMDLNIDKQERIIINDYIECIRTTCSRGVELAFMAGISNTIKFLHGINAIKNFEDE